MEPTPKLPIDIPWKHLAASPDMMDTKMLNEEFPFEWRSSLAISAYEPKQEDLPDSVCDDVITYLKVTCTITGYQPSAQETIDGYTNFPNVSTEQLNEMFEEYFACYGVILNVAVFPYDPIRRSIDDVPLKNYPHIISMEPKTRDLYQIASETGEILTASNSKVTTGKSWSHTETSETGIDLESEYALGDDNKGGKMTGSMSHKWGSTDVDTMSINSDASVERKETQGSTTQLSQMYNLLTGYHQGTNRAVFLMLPRPHTLQSTDHRTFVQGLRQIEGVQEFMLIVSRPKKVKALCIEAFLETGHFPENITINEPEQSYDTNEVPVEVGPIKVSNGGLFNPGRKEKKFLEERTGFEVNGWEFDPTRGDSGRGGISEIEKLNGDNADGSTNGPTGGKPAMEDYSFKVAGPDTVVVSGKLRSRFRSDTKFHRKYNVFLRKPKITTGESSADVTKLLITSRGLAVCMQNFQGCLNVIPSPLLFGGGDDQVVFWKESIMDERNIKIPSSLLTREATEVSRTPAVKELLSKIKKAMSTSHRLPSRYKTGEVGYLESNYFRDQVLNAMSKEDKHQDISQVENLPSEVKKKLGNEFSIEEAAKMSLSELQSKTGMSMEAVKRTRRLLLGYKEK